MHLLLIQPHDSGEALPLRELFVEPTLQSPPHWDLICLAAYVLGHTRHFCELVDARLLADPERDVPRAVTEAAGPCMAVLYCRADNLPEIKTLLSALKREHPGLPIALCGPFASDYPRQALSLDEADYVLAGDPEPILRNLADYLDLPQRLAHTPGLLTRHYPDKPPCWARSLAGFSLPDWRGIDWAPYRRAPGELLAINASMSRGHAGAPEDRFLGPTTQPLRAWPFERFHACMLKCAHHGIGRIILDDPPGFWTPHRLRQWANTLLHMRNPQRWGISLFPRELDEELLHDLGLVSCDTLHLQMPSCERRLLEAYACPEAFTMLPRLLAVAKTRGIRTVMHFWVGGPEEHRGEAERIMQAIRKLGYPPAALTPYPYHIGSPVYEDVAPEKRGANMDDITHWLRSPWTTERPVVNWRGKRGVNYTADLMDYIDRNLSRSPRRIARKAWSILQDTNLVRALEDRTLGWFARTVRPS